MARCIEYSDPKNFKHGRRRTTLIAGGPQPPYYTGMNKAERDEAKEKWEKERESYTDMHLKDRQIPTKLTSASVLVVFIPPFDQWHKRNHSVCKLVIRSLTRQIFEGLVFILHAVKPVNLKSMVQQCATHPVLMSEERRVRGIPSSHMLCTDVVRK